MREQFPVLSSGPEAPSPARKKQLELGVAWKKREITTAALRKRGCQCFMVNYRLLTTHSPMKDIASILRSLGLLESEIKTYMTALEHGPQTALDLADKSKLSRQGVYTAIESLMERGIMSSVLRGKKRFYAAEHPDKLLAYAKRRATEMNERVQDLERSLPELELQIGGERPTVRMFEGKEGVRAIISDMEQSMPKEVQEMADFDALNKVLSKEDLLPLKRQIDKRKTRVKGIYAGTPSGPTRVNVDRFYLPKEYKNFHSNITIYGDKIALVTLEGKMYSVILESAVLANTLRILHELALKCAVKEAKKDKKNWGV